MKIIWQVDDGYCGESRPQQTKINECDLEDCDTVDEAMNIVIDIVQEDFNQKISWNFQNSDNIKKEIGKLLGIGEK